MRKTLLVCLVIATFFARDGRTAATPAAVPDYSIQAIRYADLPGFPVSALVVGGPKDEKIDIAMVVWLIRGGGHNILFDWAFTARPGSRASRSPITCAR